MREIAKQFSKFAVAGVFATFVHIILLYLFTEFAGIYYLVSSAIAFIFAMTVSFLLNKTWTFNEKIREKTASKYLKFLIISVTALAVNLFFLYFLTEFIGIYYLISQLVATGLSAWVNFFGSRHWTFRHK